MKRKAARAVKAKRATEIVIDGPTEAQRSNGHYVREDMIHADEGTRVTAWVNRGGTPVMRWFHAKKIDDRQLAVINWCQKLWHIAGTTQRVCGAYGERTQASNTVELNAVRVLEASDDLKRIQGHFAGLDAWWQVFENVCRFDMPAGRAGGELGYGNRSAEDRAHTTVCFVADIIATKERM